ncbi:MAG: lysyl endopeptidase, partial [Neolewinella sp.]
MIPKNILYTAAIAWLLTGVLFGQQSLIELPKPDLNKLEREDASFNNVRFSAPVPLDLAPASAPDTYAHENGEWTWSRTFQVPSATGLALFADQLNLPEGGRLLLTNRAGSRGPFTQADASSENRLFTDFLPGELVTLTYRGPLPDETPFHLWRIDHVYRKNLWRNPFNKDFGDANSCQVNANCVEGDGWSDEKSGAARINLVVEEGVGFCSGNLINNTAMDGRPFLLTGFHCMDGFTPVYDLWAVDFDYTSEDCNNPATEPSPTRYVGVRFRAGKRETDFMLLEIIDPEFTAEDHYFAGWDRSPGDVSGKIIHFHHPIGDVQKLGVSGPEGMSVLTNQITWNNGVVTPPSHHFVMDYAVGDFEQGSSGSAYFDEDHRIRGQLNGG